MDAMQLDPEGPSERANLLEGIVQYCRTARIANRHAPDFLMISVTPDWLVDLLEPGDIENMLALHHIRIIRRSEFYAEGESQ
jgi:hypothetical protein